VDLQAGVSVPSIVNPAYLELAATRPPSPFHDPEGFSITVMEHIDSHRCNKLKT
jgi:hypothetical protein